MPAKRRAASPSASPTGPRPDVLLLLDGHSLAYRAFFALPPEMATSSGQPTNAVYGFTSMLIKLLADYGTERVAVAFDLGKPTIRLAQYAEYKAGRRETPPDFSSQLGLLREVLSSLKIPVFEVPDHEADDVLATIARRAEEAGVEAVIVTADRDAMQLVRPGVTVLFNRRGVSDIVMYDPPAVQERWGITPVQYLDYAALRGDPSDNLPGVPGVGEKTASKLIAQYGSVEAVFEHLDELTPKLRASLEAGKADVLRNKTLTRLVDDLPLDLDAAAIRMGEWNLAQIYELFNSLEFRSLYERLEGIGRAPTDVADTFVAVTGGDAATIAAAARAAGSVAVALAAGGDGLALAVHEGESTWLATRSEAIALLADPNVAITAHDAKALVRALRAGDAAPGSIAMDTMLAAYLLDPASGAYDLASVLARYLKRDLPSATPPEQDGQMSLDVGDTDLIEETCARAAALPRLGQHLASELERLGMMDLLRDVELPLAAVLAEMERTGIGIDVPMLEGMSRELGEEIAGIETRIYELAGGPFNIGSTPQLRDVLFGRLGLKPAKKTKTGFSTDAATLETLRDEHPIVPELLRYRELTKLKSTYLDALPPLIDPADGRLHATFNQAAAATGRISSENPNVQNIPVRTELGRRIRAAFVAGFPGHTLVVADYSQIELRVLAHITGDEGLRQAFANDEDIHTATAAKVWGFEPADVPKDLRSRAKMINYGLSYGMSAFGLAQRLGIAADEAAEFIEAYFKGFPGVRDFMDAVVKEAYKNGYTVTALGRRRYLPELNHSNPRIRSLGERQALNAPIQGTAADIIKLAMLKTESGLREAGLSARMVLTVHDELIFEVPDAQLRDTTEAVRSLMEQAYPLDVPLKVDIATGRSWADAKD
ncbi:MAG TPA: DNA polymerase I [Actinomycetota bacterium]|nr:DNA polymerase I [Actinomycetota bacterium]